MPSRSAVNHRPGAGLRLLALRLLLLLVLFTVWHVLTESDVLPRFFFGSPLVVLEKGARWFTSGKIYKHLAITLVETVLAFGGGTLLGLTVGLLLTPPPPPPLLIEPVLKRPHALPRALLSPNTA